MSSTTHTRLLALLLTVISLTIFGIKVFKYNYPLAPGAQTTTWDFEIYLDFNTANQPVRIETFIPAAGETRRVSQEQYYNGAFGLRLESDADAGRKAIWTYRYPDDRKVLRYRARLESETQSSPLPPEMHDSIKRGAPDELSDLERQAFIVWSSDMRRRSADNESLAELVLQEIFVEKDADEVDALLPNLPPPLDRLTLAAEVLQSQGIRARVANGIYLDEARRRTEIQHWLEYRVDGEDKRYFPGADPKEFFTIWYGTEEMIRADGVFDFDPQISIQPIEAAANDVVRRAAREDRTPVELFSFDRLPVTTQLVYQVLITIPAGIVLLVFMRQFIGIETLGTFMPILIGIAFRETALLNGLILFTMLVGLGLAMRFYLEKLRLLLVPRLAVVLIFIVICMAVIAQVFNSANMRMGLSISLFPMVILTMTIERMSIMWEEYSPTDAIKAGAGSLLVASLAYLVMTNTHIEYILFNFPELLLVLMAACLLMGKYTGMRLSEVWRFRELAGTDGAGK
ncbi:MAG TPA: UUP1 family membrane protein [Hyphomonas sp.]|nr:UUP1 family membrane protein [Hyphomonas sp.]HPE46834.1 UUP1 family membrane protein [Hyphomonas sp.]